MKKWMFSHRWGLHGAVISGEKNTTLRIIPDKIVKACTPPDSPFDYPDHELLVAASPVQVGDLVAVAEAYKDAIPPLDWAHHQLYKAGPGWTNKMYVRPELMRYFLEVQKVEAFDFCGLPKEQMDAEGFQAFLRRARENPRLKRAVQGYAIAQRTFFQKTMDWDIWSDHHFVWRYTFIVRPRGICRVCGCSIGNPCFNPEHGYCWWEDETRTLCSHCAIPKIAEDPRTTHCVTWGRYNPTDKGL